MRKLKYVKFFENFGKLNESVDENWVVKPYEFETPEDWKKEFNPTGHNSIELSSTKRPPQTEVFSWSSCGDGWDFGGSMDNVEMLYKEIKNYLTMVLYVNTNKE